ncbi:MAG: hypothetical protein ACI9WC_001317 [Arenicella sp.]|jgi:hypothetical protein
MIVLNFQTSPITYARIAGLLYLIIALFGGFSIGYVPSVVFESGDAVATAANISNHQGLYRLGIFSDIVVLLAEVVLTAILYILFKPVNQTLSLVAAFARLSMVVVMAINSLIYLMPMALLNETVSLDAFGAGQKQEIALMLLEAHQYGIYIWGILFGLHLSALGYLVIRSGYVPKILGWAMMVGSLGYLLEGLAGVTFTSNELFSMVVIGLLVVVTIGELSFAFWLLFKGITVTCREQKKQTLNARESL